MTLNEIKQAAAAFFRRSATELTTEDGIDLGLVALNQARKTAELGYDFEFSRQLLTLTVNGAIGAELDEAVIFGTTKKREIKTLTDVGVISEDGVIIPVEWTTVGESMNRQRQEHKACPRVLFSGDSVYIYPKSEETVTLALHGYAFSRPWTAADLDTVQKPWTTHGEAFMLWSTIVQLNYLFVQYVIRTEGAIAPPVDLMNQAFDSFKAWDTFRFEQSRRHNR